MDITTLARYDQIDVNSGKFKRLCEKNAPEEGYEEIIKIFSDE